MSVQWIERLVSLQDIDLKIRDLNLRLSLIPKEKQKLKEQANKNLSEIEKEKTQLNSLKLKVQQNESKIDGLKEQIAKLEQQSSLVKKNSEYEAMLHSIAEYKNSIDNLDEYTLELMDLIEQKEATFAKNSADVKILNRSLKAEFMELDDLSKNLKEKISELTPTREMKATRIEPEILNRYNSLISRNIGKPLSLIENDVCTNCHRKVTASTINSAKKGLVTYCDNCQYFLYLEENL